MYDTPPTGKSAKNRPQEVTALGTKYCSLPEGPEKEQVLLELLQFFHGYLKKYLEMILRGRIPFYLGGANEDSRLFLHRFMRKDTENWSSLSAVCRTLHLAFKGQDAGEVYDILVMCLLRALQKYDPFYHKKVQQVVDIIERKFPCPKQFTAYELNSELEFNGTGIARLLARHGFLEARAGP